MRIICAIFVICGSLSAQMWTQMRDGVERALVFHSATGELVTDQNPAQPGEILVVMASGMTEGVRVVVNGVEVPAAALDEQSIEFTLPAGAAGSFVELRVAVADRQSNAATLPVAAAAADGVNLSAAEVDQLVKAAAGALNDQRMVVAVVDRAGRPLAVYRKPLATDGDVEDALSVARTSAFFSHNQAPLSSRTINTLSQEHFPSGIPNQPAAALFGIQLSNKGCNYNTTFLPGKLVPQPLNATGDGVGRGVNVAAGSVPLYRDGAVMIGGIGVAGVPELHAEFAVVAATFGTPFFVKLPLPSPGAVFIDGIRLPFVVQTTRPDGSSADGNLQGIYQIAPRDGAPAPEEWLVGPKAGQALSADEVRTIIERGVAVANRTRAAIRLPLGSRSRMVLAVADLNGDLLGVYRMPDSTVFSIDVSVTKARNMVYFSSASVDPRDLPGIPPGTAVTNRSIGFGSQPFFPSGINNSTPGPFRDLFTFDDANPCTQGRQPKNPFQSGVVFFPGSSSLYRNGQLVGGLGVSGDGVEQDDYVTAGAIVGFEVPENIRADKVFIRGVRIPYFKFPRNPEQ